MVEKHQVVRFGELDNLSRPSQFSLRSDVSEPSGFCKVVAVWLLLVKFDASF